MDNQVNDAAPEAVEDPLIVEAREVAAAAEKQPNTGQDDPAAEAEEGAEGEGHPQERKPKVQDRIDELTRLRRDAERERDHWREMAMRGGKPQADQPQQRQEQRQDVEPDPTKYKGGGADPAYIRDLGAFSARQEFARLSEANQRRQAAEAAHQTWAQRQEAFTKDHPDFAEVAFAENLPLTPTMADAIQSSEVGPQVAYHLGKNPDEARRISGLNPLAQVREIGKLEAKLAPAGDGSEAPKPQPKTVSDAPGPAPGVRGSGGKFKVAPDTDDFAAFEKAYGA